MSAAPLLSIFRDGEKIKEISVQANDGDLILGRGDQCKIRLDDRAISREHLAFFSKAGSLEVRKKSKFAPFLLNGIESGDGVLKAGDRVQVGPYLILVESAKTELDPVSPVSPPTPSAPPYLPPISETMNISPELQTNQNLEFESNFEASAPQEIPAEPSLIDNSSEREVSHPIDIGFQVVASDGATRVAANPNLRAVLTLKSGVANVQEYLIEKDSISIGRGKKCEIVLADKRSSRRHCEIFKKDTGFFIKDLDSANYTLLNGEKIKESELSSHDIIKIGDTEIGFKIVDENFKQKFEARKASSEQRTDFPTQPSISIDSPEIDLGEKADSTQSAAQPVQSEFESRINSESAGSDFGAPQMISGLNPEKKDHFSSKFAKNRTLLLILMVGLLGGYTLFDQEIDQVIKSLVGAPKKGKKKQVADLGTKDQKEKKSVSITFETLNPEQQRFVREQRNLGFDLYKNHRYEEAIDAINKIFTIIPDFEDSKEIKRYAEEGRDIERRKKEEAEKKIEEERQRQKTAALVQRTEVFMKAGNYISARQLFPEVLALDPENKAVGFWQKEIEDFEEDQRRKAEEKALRDEVNKKVWDRYFEGEKLQKTGDFFDAIEVFEDVLTLEASDQKVFARAKNRITETRQMIRNRLLPLLEQGKSKETEGDLSEAYRLYARASKIDPGDLTGVEGMKRIRDVLRSRARIVYTEAVLAESFSEFVKAKTKFQEVLSIVPEDDDYYEKAQSKLNKYEPFRELGGKNE
jgi:pSer/pThr/pTyr-binding forkhead associated (FHA) protein/tetratricopeptide (TPR) repeat protein